MSTFEVPETAAILDLVNVMTYDISGSATSGVTDFNAALRASSTAPETSDEHRYQNVEGTVAAFVEAGVPPEKLIVGMPFYGRGFTGVPEKNNGLYQPFSGSMSARYHEIAADYLPTFQRQWHDEAGVPWLFSGERQVMLSYDDPESLGLKADYINEQGLGGAMFWELSGDDAEWSLLNALTSRLRP
jgi:chitinase